MKKQYIIASALCATLILGSIVFAYTSMQTDITENTSPYTAEPVSPTPTRPTPSAPVDASTSVTVDPDIETPIDTTPSTCVTGGCSGQLCVDSKTSGDIVSTCEYRASYACYKAKSARCERQANGQCGWTQTTTLVQCLKDAENAPADGSQPQ